MSAIVDRFVWKKRTKGKAGIRWDKVVENIWKEIGGNKQEIMSIDNDMIELREKKAETESRRGRAPQDIRRVERGDRNDNIFTRPNRL